jgi:hypothetical protein
MQTTRLQRAAPAAKSDAITSDAAQTDAPHQVSAETAKALVGLIPGDLSLSQQRLELGAVGWHADGSGEFLELKFPKAVPHSDGPFVRAFIDLERNEVWFVTKVEDQALQKAIKRSQNPPKDLMGEPSPPTVNLVGGVALGKLAKDLGVGAQDVFTDR